MRTAIVVALAVTSLGCGGNICSRNSPCPNDAQRTQAQRDQCQATLDAYAGAACFNEVLDLENCYMDNQVCGADGTTDTNLSNTKATTNCTNPSANLSACCVKNPASTACKA